MKELVQQISKCTLCAAALDHEPRPVFSVHSDSKIIIIGQAPGSIVHRTGIPWNDKSGENLRKWMDIDEATFYDNTKIAIVPMGFCYPGKGKSGDLPPRKECAPQWHSLLLEEMKKVKLTILIGKYAQDFYLKKDKRKNLTLTVQDYKLYLPQYFVLPHPSPRNNIWMKKNPWFQKEVIPSLQTIIKNILV